LGSKCEHPIYAVGGELVELLATSDGSDVLRHIPAQGYQRRGKPGSYREYLLVTTDCLGTEQTVRVPLFRTDGPSNGPRGGNTREVSRVYAPGSPQFKYHYAARNDTEARHSDLKSRTRHLPRDVAGQELRLLGAAMTINAAAWQVHLQGPRATQRHRRHRLATTPAPPTASAQPFGGLSHAHTSKGWLLSGSNEPQDRADAHRNDETGPLGTGSGFSATFPL
jgi:hypothetical protein